MVHGRADVQPASVERSDPAGLGLRVVEALDALLAPLTLQDATRTLPGAAEDEQQAAAVLALGVGDRHLDVDTQRVAHGAAAEARLEREGHRLGRVLQGSLEEAEEVRAAHDRTQLRGRGGDRTSGQMTHPFHTISVRPSSRKRRSAHLKSL